MPSGETPKYRLRKPSGLAVATFNGRDSYLGPWKSKASLTIFGQAREHELFAQHIANSEFWVEVTGLGRTVREWSLKPSKPDNHWLDCLVGCAAAASILGVTLPSQASQPRHGPLRKRVSASAMLARRENRQNL
jgi:hypothetical protein